MKLEVILPADDADGAALVSGKATFEEFIRRFYGGGTINGIDLQRLFLGTAPEVSIHDNIVTVVAHSPEAYRHSGQLPIIQGSLNFEFPSPRPRGSQDTFTITLTDYTILSADPLPDELTENKAKWSGKDQATSRAKIKIKLGFAPAKSPFKLLVLFRLNPFQLLSSWGTKLYYFVESFLDALPFLWLLWLLHRGTLRHKLFARQAPQLESGIHFMIAFCFLLPVLSLVDSAAEPFQKLVSLPPGLVSSGDTPADHLAWKSVILISLGILAFAFLLALRFLNSDSLRSWVQPPLCILLFALLLGLIPMGLGLLLEMWSPGWAFWQMRSVIMLAPLLGVFTFSIWRWYPSDQDRLRVLTIAVAASILFLLYTLSLRNSPVVSPYSDPHAVKADVYVRTSCQVIGMILPYLALQVILPLLQRMADSSSAPGQLLLPNDIGESSLQIGTLIFALYIVGTYDRMFMLIPVPFLLALLLFRRLLKPPVERFPVGRDAIFGP